jgi:hypothetical protein
MLAQHDTAICARLRGREAVRAGHRLRADEKHIRAQSAILDKGKRKMSLLLSITMFLVRSLYPYQKHG